MNNIYSNIKAIREKKGLSQQQMADKLNIVVSGYGKIERGQTHITIERLTQVAFIFEMHIVDIILYKQTAEEKEKEIQLNNLIKESDNNKLKAYQDEINDLVRSKVDMRSTRYGEIIPYHELEDWDLVWVQENGITTEEEYLNQPSERFTPEGDQKAFEEIIAENLDIYLLFEKGFITDVFLLVHWDNFVKKGTPLYVSESFGSGTITTRADFIKNK
jgi:transcriptional regulator with XRE-family HTH domain